VHVFYLSDGKHTFTDWTGIELAGLADVREHARVQVREIKGALSEQTLQSWSGWTTIVVNANGKPVFEIGFGCWADRIKERADAKSPIRAKADIWGERGCPFSESRPLGCAPDFNALQQQ
jgi:uncharacterized protein DUF6894